jgi:hypothetical protein
MKKNIALAVLLLFVLGNLSFAAETVKAKTTVKGKTAVVKTMKTKSAKMMEKSKSTKTMEKAEPKMTEKKDVEQKPVHKRSFLRRVWHKLFGWMHKKPAEPATTTVPAPKK